MAEDIYYQPLVAPYGPSPTGWISNRSRALLSSSGGFTPQNPKDIVDMDTIVITGSSMGNIIGVRMNSTSSVYVSGANQGFAPYPSPFDWSSNINHDQPGGGVSYATENYVLARMPRHNDYSGGIRGGFTLEVSDGQGWYPVPGTGTIGNYADSAGANHGASWWGPLTIYGWDGTNVVNSVGGLASSNVIRDVVFSGTGPVPYLNRPVFTFDTNTVKTQWYVEPNDMLHLHLRACYSPDLYYSSGTSKVYMRQLTTNTGQTVPVDKPCKLVDKERAGLGYMGIDSILVWTRDSGSAYDWRTWEQDCIYQLRLEIGHSGTDVSSSYWDFGYVWLGVTTVYNNDGSFYNVLNTQPYPTDPPVGLRVGARTTSTLDISWSAPAYTGTYSDVSYQLVYREWNVGSYIYTPRLTGTNYRLEGFATGTYVEVAVNAMTSAGVIQDTPIYRDEGNNFHFGIYPIPRTLRGTNPTGSTVAYISWESSTLPDVGNFGTPVITAVSRSNLCHNAYPPGWGSTWNPLHMDMLGTTSSVRYPSVSATSSMLTALTYQSDEDFTINWLMNPMFEGEVVTISDTTPRNLLRARLDVTQYGGNGPDLKFDFSTGEIFTVPSGVFNWNYQTRYNGYYCGLRATKSTKLLEFFYNGSVMASYTLTGSFPSGSGLPGALTFGSCSISAAVGIIDQFQFDNVALPDYQIAYIHSLAIYPP